MESSTLEMTIEGMGGSNIQEVMDNFLFLLNKAPDIKRITFRCNGDIIDVHLIYKPFDGWTFKQIKYDMSNDGKVINE